jgi:hypothetical protein
LDEDEKQGDSRAKKYQLIDWRVAGRNMMVYLSYSSITAAASIVIVFIILVITCVLGEAFEDTIGKPMNLCFLFRLSLLEMSAGN